MRYIVEIAGEALELCVERTADGGFNVRTEAGEELSARTLAQQPGLHALLIAGQTLEVQLGERQVKLAGARFSVRTESERQRLAIRAVAQPRVSKQIVAPMPGRVVRVLCVAGAAVRSDEPLVVIEAMKMQNELCAKADEVVRAIHVVGGETVDRGALLLEFE